MNESDLRSRTSKKTKKKEEKEEEFWHLATIIVEYRSLRTLFEFRFLPKSYWLSMYHLPFGLLHIFHIHQTSNHLAEKRNEMKKNLSGPSKQMRWRIHNHREAPEKHLSIYARWRIINNFESIKTVAKFVSILSCFYKRVLFAQKLQDKPPPKPLLPLQHRRPQQKGWEGFLSTKKTFLSKKRMEEVKRCQHIKFKFTFCVSQMHGKGFKCDTRRG